ncbi:MAG: pilus assembly PilX N-terminal domain-containing protein, partial [Candidatus Aminicenantes bacterium]|nr:pilus assembly PilX N-terminal domain-containing protein [Candidatus Aminicenantes bacterium]
MSNFGAKKNKSRISLLNKEEGFALVVTILIMVLLTVMGLGILVVSDIESKIGANFRSHTQALYIAESGIERVISYFNNPASFTDVTGTYNGYTVSSMTDAQSFFAKRRLQGIVPSFFNIYGLSQFEDTDNNGVIDSPPHDYTNPVLKYNRDTSSAQEDFLESITPDASDQCYIYELMVFAPPPTVGAVATVRVTARVRNASRTVEQIMMPGPILAFTSGLASGAGASWNGCSLLVHWGEVK